MSPFDISDIYIRTTAFAAAGLELPIAGIDAANSATRDIFYQTR